jgi:hypothetical protein
MTTTVKDLERTTLGRSRTTELDRSSGQLGFGASNGEDTGTFRADAEPVATGGGLDNAVEVG